MRRVVLLMGPLALLPTPALAGVILVSALGLINLQGIRRIWDQKRSEGLIAIVALVGVIVYGTLAGVGIAVLLAALNIVRRAAWPQIAEEGRQPDGSWRELHRSGGRRVRSVAVLRFSGPLFFANGPALQAHVREIVASRPDVRAVILDLAATPDIDLTAGGLLRELVDELGKADRHLAVARPLGTVRDELRAYGLAELMDPTAGTMGTVDAAILGLGLDADYLDEDLGPGVVAGTAAPGQLPAAPVDGNRLVLRVSAADSRSSPSRSSWRSRSDRPRPNRGPPRRPSRT